jgi:hypothetical protein
MAVDIAFKNEAALEAGVPHRLFQAGGARIVTASRPWDVTPDGQRFLINVLNEGAAQTPSITLVTNWLAQTIQPR